MATLKDKLAAMPDLTYKMVKVADGGLEVKIKRFTVREREELFKLRSEFLAGSENQDQAIGGSLLSKKSVIMGCVEPTVTDDDINDIDSKIVDEISNEIFEFNGWTSRAQGVLADQFPPSAGSPVPVPSGA